MINIEDKGKGNFSTADATQVAGAEENGPRKVSEHKKTAGKRIESQDIQKEDLRKTTPDRGKIDLIRDEPERSKRTLPSILLDCNKKPDYEIAGTINSSRVTQTWDAIEKTHEGVRRQKEMKLPRNISTEEEVIYAEKGRGKAKNEESSEDEIEIDARREGSRKGNLHIRRSEETPESSERRNREKRDAGKAPKPITREHSDEEDKKQEDVLSDWYDSRDTCEELIRKANHKKDETHKRQEGEKRSQSWKEPEDTGPQFASCESEVESTQNKYKTNEDSRINQGAKLTRPPRSLSRESTGKRKKGDDEEEWKRRIEQIECGSSDE